MRCEYVPEFEGDMDSVVLIVTVMYELKSEISSWRSIFDKLTKKE